MIFNLNHFVDQLYGGQSSRISNWFAVRIERSEAGKMPCESKIVVLHYFHLRATGKTFAAADDDGASAANLLYPKIGEIRSVRYAAMDQKTEGTVLVTRFRIKYGVGIWGRRDCVTAHGVTDCARTVSSSLKRRSPSVPVRMIWPGI